MEVMRVAISSELYFEGIAVNDFPGHSCRCPVIEERIQILNPLLIAGQSVRIGVCSEIDIEQPLLTGPCIIKVAQRRVGDLLKIGDQLILFCRGAGQNRAMWVGKSAFIYGCDHNLIDTDIRVHAVGDQFYSIVRSGKQVDVLHALLSPVCMPPVWRVAGGWKITPALR